MWDHPLMGMFRPLPDPEPPAPEPDESEVAEGDE